MCQRYPDFRRHSVEIFAVVNEDRARCAGLRADFQATFPFLADPDRDLVTRYGVYHRTDPDGRPIPVPGAFLIDPEGIVRYIFVGDTPSHRPELGEILDAIATLDCS